MSRVFPPELWVQGDIVDVVGVVCGRKPARAQSGRVMRFGRQTTLRDQAVLSGVGVHTGLPVTLILHPADANSGISFIRTGLDGGREREICADIRAVTATEFATVLGDASGPLISTAEHVLSALRGLGIDNAVVEVDGPEVPIMDGSAAAFVAAIDQVGIVTLNEPRRFIRVLKPVRVANGASVGELRPYSRGLKVEVEIEFDNPLVGRQSFALDCRPDTFRTEIARARTFGFMRDVAKLWKAGYALGASLENTLVIAENRVLNPEGTRFADEFVRHKVLDALGDLALAGMPLLGAYRSVRGGHKLNFAVLSALMADTSAWTIVEAEPQRPIRGHSDVAAGLSAAAYAPDVS
jgi:UDP-3-O-[3-hydroxymyristoyl] N-acetylglucosamine deacetylase